MEEDGGPAKRARTDEGDADGEAAAVKVEPEEEDGEVGEEEEAVAELSASQVSNMVSEMLEGSQQASRAGQRHPMEGMLRMCFSADTAAMQLLTGETLVTGRDVIIDRILRGVCAPSAPPLAQPLARVFIECEGAPVSFSLDIYTKQAPSPVANLGAGQGGGGGATVVLFRVRACQIDQILISDGGGLKNWWRSREALESSATWKCVLLAVKLSLKAQATLTIHYNNYQDATDATGLGIGSVSVSETWNEKMLPPPTAQEIQKAKAEDNSKATMGFEKVAAHLANDKKFSKAAPLLRQMLSTHLNQTTAPAAMAALRAALGPGGSRVRAEESKDLVLELVTAAWEHRAAIAGEGSDERDELESWRLHSMNAKQLDTDDTFTFAKAAKEVMVALEGMTGKVARHRSDALTANLEAMAARYSFAWSRGSVDMAFKVLVDPKKRECLVGNKEKIEKMASAIVAKRKAKEALAQSDYQSSGFQHGKMGW